jgi:branched-chain amino acid transport system permease protein
MFPIVQDRVFVVLIVLAANIVPPAFLGNYWFNAVLLPFLIFSMAALGLNLLVGYCGQLSLGTGGFMAVGAYASYKFTTSFPDLGMIFVFLLSGFVAAAVAFITREPAHQGFLSRGGDARGAVLPAMALQQGALVLQL